MNDEKWKIDYDDRSLLIYGPGDLEIEIRDFDSKKSISQGFDEEISGDLQIFGVMYPLYPSEIEGETVYLEAVRVKSRKKGTAYGILHIGSRVCWRFSAQFVEELQDALLGVTSQKARV